MDFRLTEEQRLVRDTARDFVDRELIPHVRDWEEKGEVPRSFYRKMASLGFLGAPVPVKYGGCAVGAVSSLFLPRGVTPGCSPRPPAAPEQPTLCGATPLGVGPGAGEGKV